MSQPPVTAPVEQFDPDNGTLTDVEIDYTLQAVSTMIQDMSGSSQDFTVELMAALASR